MKTNQKMLLAALAMTAGLSGYAAVPVVSLGNAVATEAVADLKAVPSGSLVINGTGNSATFTINAQNLTEQIRLTATPGLEVYPEVLPAGAANATVRVTLLSTLPQTKGQVFLRSGDYRAVMNVLAYGTELEQKDLTDPVFTGSEKKFEAREADGFKPGDKGYTVEFRVKHSKPIDTFEAFAVTPGAGSFMTYVEPELMGVYNGTSRVNIENPLNDKDGGKKSFYNKDGKFHTYRFAVTSDKRMFVYRDGVQVATLRTGDYGEQADWAVENGDVVENLLKNGNFEGEWNTRADSLVNRVEGWFVDPIDRYNCTYEVP
ncbi:MAG: hypothetical protein K2F63_05600, partial [Muribaculaceae bacterium]|nr:hypothetical protein [Muribaculaceae bacterium]